MDYDGSKIPAIYDRARELAPDLLQSWLDRIARDANPAPGGLIIDVGCGSGRFSRPLAERFRGPVLGIDPSERMLALALEKAGNAAVRFHRAGAEALPLAPAAAELVFLSMVFHHLPDPGAAVGEFRRVLRPGGHVCVRTSTREGEFPHKRFFPGIEAELPTRREIERTFAAAGLACVAQEIVVQRVAACWPDFVDRIALRGYSTVARLSDSDFAAGMAALQSHVPAGGADGPVSEEVDWFVFRAP